MKSYTIQKAEKIALAVSKLERVKVAHKGLSSEIKNRTKQQKANSNNAMLLGYGGIRQTYASYGSFAMATPNSLTACTQIGLEPEEMAFILESAITSLEHSIENLLDPDSVPH